MARWIGLACGCVFVCAFAVSAQQPNKPTSSGPNSELQQELKAAREQLQKDQQEVKTLQQQLQTDKKNKDKSRQRSRGGRKTLLQQQLLHLVEMTRN